MCTHPIHRSLLHSNCSRALLYRPRPILTSRLTCCYALSRCILVACAEASLLPRTRRNLNAFST
jgi:hypothetical protein